MMLQNYSKLKAGSGMTSFIFVTGGVVSSLGKGLASASLGAILMALMPLITIFLSSFQGLESLTAKLSQTLLQLRKVYHGFSIGMEWV